MQCKISSPSSVAGTEQAIAELKMVHERIVAKMLKAHQAAWVDSVEREPSKAMQMEVDALRVWAPCTSGDHDKQADAMRKERAGLA